VAAGGRIKHVIQSVAGLFADPVVQPAIPTQPHYKAPADVNALASGFRTLDKALGVNGLPQGKITELIGAGNTLMSGGSHSVAARIGAKVQRQQEIITIIDMNHSFDPWQAERCGLVAPQLLLIRPDTIFSAITALEQASRNAKLVIVVMGIVADLLSHVEKELLQTLLHRLQTIVQQSESVFLFVTTSPQNDPFNPKMYPQGFSLDHVASVRLWLQDENWAYEDGVTSAYKATITVVKNDLAMVGKAANIRIKLNEF
jgi:recombination protein RecA